VRHPAAGGPLSVMIYPAISVRRPYQTHCMAFDPLSSQRIASFVLHGVKTRRAGTKNKLGEKRDAEGVERRSMGRGCSPPSD